MQSQPRCSNNQETSLIEPIIIHDAEETRAEESRKTNCPVENQSGNQPSHNETGTQSSDPLEPGEIPHSNPRISSEAVISEPAKETRIDPSLLESNPGEDSDEGDSSSSLPAALIKNPRGRKSKKKMREEVSYLAVLEGSQKTLKGILNTRSKKGGATASKGASPPRNSSQ